MTGIKVVDASAIAAVLLDEPATESVRALLQDATLVAPALIHTELAHVMVKNARRYPDHAAALCTAFELRHRLLIESMDVNHDEVLALAISSGLSAYDASYLWLANDLGAELVTLDKRLLAAFTPKHP